MNENIENCLYQAGLTAQGCWDELDDYAREGIEKFAELIVRECIDIVSPYAVRMEDFDGGHPIADLKKHFGVKE
jgi:hypothetical protein